MKTFKTLRKYYEKVETGEKTFELRKDDRPEGMPEVNEEICLVEIDDTTLAKTGRSLNCKVLYVLKDETYLQPGYYAMSVERVASVAVQRL